MHDLHYAVRRLLRQPAFTTLVVATLALGIGSATAMFAVFNGVLLEPLPYGSPDRLVWMYGSFRMSQSAAVSPLDFVDYRTRNEIFDSLAAMTIAISSATVAGAEGPVRLQRSQMSAAMLATLGVPLVAGREFRRDEERESAAALLISERLAAERFSGARQALGRSLVVDGRPRTVVGVVPAGFVLPYDSFIRVTGTVDLLEPVALDSPEAHVRRFHYLRLIGRLKPHATLVEAQAHMDVIARQLEAAYPENETWRLRLVPLHERIVGGVRPALRVLMAAVALLLVIACTNVGAVVLARSHAAREEIALRGALGASLWRVVRQFLAEGTVLSLAGAVLGMAIAWWTVGLLERFAPSLPRVGQIANNGRVVVFAAGIAAIATVLFGLLPALAAARRALAAGMSGAGRSSGDRAHGRARALLMMTQVAVSVIILTATGLLTRSFQRLLSVDPGFAATGILLAEVALPEDRYQTGDVIEAYHRTLLERLASAPGIEAAGLCTIPPLVGATDMAVHPEGQPPASPRDRRFAQIRRVEGNYFETLQIPILAGRRFDDAVDRPGSALAAVISRNLAIQLFGTPDAAGRRLIADMGEPTAVDVVGVAADVRLFGPDSNPSPTVYLSGRQLPAGFSYVVARTAVDESALASIIRDITRSIDPALAPAPVRSMQALLDESVAQPRFRMLLIAAFSSIAVSLTLVGLYGTLAYSVGRRTREIGIRFALGARTGQVVGMVLRQGAAIVAAGLAAGLAAAAFLTRFLAALLFDVRPLDPLVFAGVPALFSAVALVAIVVPALRAARIDPTIALRVE